MLFHRVKCFFESDLGFSKKSNIPQLNDKMPFFSKRQKRTLFCLVFSSTRFGCEDHAEMSATDENEAVKHPPSNYIDNLCSIRLCLSNFYTRRVLKCRHRVSEQNSFWLRAWPHTPYNEQHLKLRTTPKNRHFWMRRGGKARNRFSVQFCGSWYFYWCPKSLRH